MTEAVVLFEPVTIDAAVDAVCTTLESHMPNFTDLAKRQFVKRVCKLVAARPPAPKMTLPSLTARHNFQA